MVKRAGLYLLEAGLGTGYASRNEAIRAGMIMVLENIKKRCGDYSESDDLKAKRGE